MSDKNPQKCIICDHKETHPHDVRIITETERGKVTSFFSVPLCSLHRAEFYYFDDDFFVRHNFDPLSWILQTKMHAKSGCVDFDNIPF